MHILSMLDHKSRLKFIYWYAIYLEICMRIDCTHSRSWVAYFTGCGTTRPGGGGGRPGVGPSSMLSSRCWANVGLTGVTVWAVTGGWPGTVCELLSPFEHAKYQYLCKNDDNDDDEEEEDEDEEDEDEDEDEHQDDDDDDDDDDYDDDYDYDNDNDYHYYYYSWQSLVKALTSLFINSVLHWVRYEHSIALVTEKILLVTILSHRGTDKHFLL